MGVLTLAVGETAHGLCSRWATPLCAAVLTTEGVEEYCMGALEVAAGSSEVVLGVEHHAQAVEGAAHPVEW